MATYTPEEILRAVQEEKLRREAELSFYEFIRQAWHVIEPGVPFVDGWHIKTISEHLEAVTRGDIRRLLINLPPRNSKSSIVSVLWPMWEWLQKPHHKYLCASYSGILSIRDNVKSRRLIQSNWYQERWGDRFVLTGDQNQKQRFENDKTGYRLATSVGGSATGEGGSRLICLHGNSYIETEHGSMRIGDIVDNRAQVKVLAYDHGKHVPVLAGIARFEKSKGRRSLKLVTAQSEIIATHDHPVFVIGKGYTQLSEVRPGDCLQRILGEDTVLAVEPIETPDFVYNVAVEQYHNYFANGILLHNCDDPHSADEAQSEAMRAATIEWFDQVWSTRLNDPKQDAMVVIMQRLHEKDVSGHIIDDIRGWEHICLPAEFDGVRRSTILGEYDPRVKDGELLCPERFGEKELDSLKILLGDYGSSGQLQQNPTPTGGGILKTRYFQLWPHDEPIPQFEYVIQSYDTAHTEKTTGDPSACTVWAVFFFEGVKQVMLIDAWTEHLAYPDLRERVVEDWSLEYGGMTERSPHHKSRRADRILIEQKASGQSLIQDLKLARVPVVSYNPGRADKISRAHMATPLLEECLIWVPESKKVPGHPVSWARKFIDQVAKFPVGAHDDFVDTFTQTIIYLKDSRILELAEAKDPDRPPREKVKRENPYAA